MYSLVNHPNHVLSLSTDQASENHTIRARTCDDSAGFSIGPLGGSAIMKRLVDNNQ